MEDAIMAKYQGTTGNDTLVGANEKNLFDNFGIGHDVVTGGSADDVFHLTPDDITDTVDGRGGNDTIDYSGSKYAVGIDLMHGSVTATFHHQYPISYDATVTVTQVQNIENATGSVYGDTIYGTNGSNTLDGNSGDDYLYGLDGSDTLIGGEGADHLYGGAGIDTVDYSSAPSSDWLLPGNIDVNGVFVNLRDNVGLNSDAQGDTYVSVENVRGSAFTDLIGGDGQSNALYGNAGDDVICGFGGADYLDGGDGIDTLSYYASPSGVAVNLGTNNVSGGDAAGDTILNFENVIGSNYADKLLGSGGDNVLDGQGGDDILRGGAGSDTFRFGPASTQFPDSALGHDTILDYTVGVDHLKFDNQFVHSVSDLQFAQNGSDTVITYFDEAATASITLTNVSETQLLAHAQTDFIFVI